MAIMRKEKFKGLSLSSAYFRITRLVWHATEDDQGWLSVISVYTNQKEATPEIMYDPVPEELLLAEDKQPLIGAAREAKIAEIQAKPDWPRRKIFPEPLYVFNGPRVKDDPEVHPKKLVYLQLMADWAEQGAVAI